MPSTSPLPTLSVYGKLPLSKEFLRYRCSSGAVGQFYQWINAGFDHTVRFGGEKERLVGADWRVLYFADGLRDLVVGTIRESADNEGLRRFPFACYTAVPRENLPEGTDGQVEACTPLWQSLARADRELSANVDLEGFKQTFRDCELKAPGSLGSGTRLDAFPLASVIAALAERSAPGEDPSRVVTNALHELALAVRVLDSRTIPGDRLPALRLPLHGELDTLAQARAWLACLGPVGFLARRRTPVTVFVPSEGAGPRDLWLVIRPPRASDFGLFTAAPSGHFYPDPGGVVVRIEGEPYAAFSDRVKRALLGEERTLADLARFRLV